MSKTVEIMERNPLKELSDHALTDRAYRALMIVYDENEDEYAALVKCMYQLHLEREYYADRALTLLAQREGLIP